MAAPRKGTIVDERYKLDRKIGSGGMADVWLADDKELDRKVAIKILARPLRPGQGVRRALPPRGPVGGRPAAPERGLHLRPRRVPGHLLHRDGVRGRAAAEAAGQGRDGHPGRDRLHAPDPQRRPLRPPQGHRPPGPEAPERAHRRGRPRPRRRLRHRPRRELGHHRDRLGDGDRPVPLARAGPGQGDDPALGHLLDRGDPLRGADRPGPVRGRQRRRGRPEAGLRDAAPPQHRQPERAAGAGRGRDAGAGQGPRGALQGRRRLHEGARRRRARARPAPARGHGRLRRGLARGRARLRRRGRGGLARRGRPAPPAPLDPARAAGRGGRGAGRLRADPPRHGDGPVGDRASPSRPRPSASRPRASTSTSTRFPAQPPARRSSSRTRSPARRSTRARPSPSASARGRRS